MVGIGVVFNDNFCSIRAFFTAGLSIPGEMSADCRHTGLQLHKSAPVRNLL